MFTLGFEKLAISRKWAEKYTTSGFHKRLTALYNKYGNDAHKYMGKGGGKARPPHDDNWRDPFTAKDMKKYVTHLRKNFPKVGK